MKSSRARARVGAVAFAAVAVGLGGACSSDEPGTAERDETTSETTTDSTTSTTAGTNVEFAERWSSALGTADRECLDVAALDLADGGPDGAGDPAAVVRSGEILAGPFGLLAGVGTPGAQDFRAKIFWVPNNTDIARTEDLTLLVEFLDTGGVEPTELVLPGAHSGDGYFWPSSTPLPSSGTWRLTATAPGHWGCFEVNVPDETAASNA